jgi:hypothetical protein
MNKNIHRDFQQEALMLTQAPFSGAMKPITLKYSY